MKKIKVCGMRDTSNISEVKNLSPDLMGFIFFKGSSRFVGEEFVMPELPEEIQKVGVFVNEDLEQVCALAAQYNLQFLQLHGNETAAYCEALKTKGFGVIKAFSVGDSFDFEVLDAYAKHVDYFLFDTSGDGYGGHGRSFDWDILKAYSSDIPFLIAGGISNHNIQELLQLEHANFAGVDVNSKFEISPGFKDIGALKQLFLTLRT